MLKLSIRACGARKLLEMSIRQSGTMHPKTLRSFWKYTAADTGIALTSFQLYRQPFGTCCLQQPLVPALLESGISGKTIGLGLDLRVRVDALQLSGASRCPLQSR